MDTERFDPVKFTIPENKFLLEALGQPPIIAMQTIPPGVVPAAVRPLLSRVYELEELSKHERRQVWVGIEAMKNAIQVYLEQAVKWEVEHKRGAPRFPSMHSFDSRHRPHLGGPGSDSGQVRTYFDKEGNRKPLAIDLFDVAPNTWAPEWATSKEASKKVEDLGDPGLTINREMQRIECFCGHTEKFSNDSPQSFNMARGRISKHLRTTTNDVEQHREIHTNVFGA